MGGGAGPSFPPLLEARGVTRRYPSAGGRLGRRAPPLVAVREVSLALAPGETVGLVGESGSGKSTLGRLLLALEPADEGRILFRGRELSTASRRELAEFRRSVQIIFQDPFASLNPRMTVGAMLGEVLRVHGLARGAAVDARVAELLGLVGLDPSAARRWPHEFSGGQRQRIGIARALSVEPEAIVADEPVSALDVSVQAHVLDLLGDLQRRLGLAYLFISHDLAVVRQVADRVLVMREGRIVERGTAAEMFARPREAYTRTLLASVPRLPAGTRRGPAST